MRGLALCTLEEVQGKGMPPLGSPTAPRGGDAQEIVASPNRRKALEPEEDDEDVLSLYELGFGR